MLNAALPLPVGTAIKLLFEPSAGAQRVRILRKLSDTFTGQDDGGAVAVYDGIGDATLIDFTNLVNGTVYYYCEYDFDGTDWTGTPSLSATPASSFTDSATDVLSLLRTRLEEGLKPFVAAGRLKHDNNTIPVYSAPPTFENVRWPAVSVHLREDAPEIRGIGEEPFDEVIVDGIYQANEGWIAGVRIEVVGWSLNPDERIALRQCIKAVMIGNLPVFAAAGMQLVNFSQSDQEDFESYSAPVYTTNGQFSCLAPSVITFADGGRIVDVTVDADADQGD